MWLALTLCRQGKDQQLCHRIVPVQRLQISTIPNDVQLLCQRHDLTAQKLPALQGRMAFAQGDDLTGESQHVPILFGQTPIEPADLVILAPGVVVATLTAQHLVTCLQHRHPLAQHQNCHEVLRLSLTQCKDLRFRGLPFHPAVPAQVVGVTVAIILTVVFIVLLVVTHQIPEGKTVMTGNEVDAVEGMPIESLIIVAAAGKACGNIR